MPYPSGVTLYGGIYVLVSDSNTTDVQFSIDDAGKRYFNIVFASSNGKRHVAKLITTSRINFQHDFVFNITATVSVKMLLSVFNARLLDRLLLVYIKVYASYSCLHNYS